MKVQCVVLLLLSGAFLVSSASTQAQDFPSDPRLPRTHSDDLAAMDTHPVALSGKVSVEGGAEITKDIVVALNCGFGDLQRTSVDSKGNFTLMIGHGESSIETDGTARRPDLTGCILHGEAPGYQSSTLDLQGHQTGVVEVGTIVLSPFAAETQGATVSVASLAAPANAKKNFAKGEDQAKKGKWAAACDYFRKAIQAYPRYAVAWLELGRAQLRQNNVNDAQQAFVSATTQDSKLLPAYVELANLQAAQRQWSAMSRTTANLVELAPQSSAAFWFLDSAANYNVHNLERAESSAQRGLRLDPGHRVPQLEYLYGLILGTKQNYGLAVQHIKTYLQLSPKAQDAREAKGRLAEFENLASTQTTEAATK